MAMNQNELKTAARNMTASLFDSVFEENAAVQFADGSWAILQTIDGQEVWTEVTIKSKAFKATKVSEAFDPYTAAEAWQEDKRIKAEEKAAKELEKQRKIAAGKK